MAFSDYEESIDQGEPINLYRFTYGPMPGDWFLYTDAEEDIAHNGNTWKAIPIERGDINSSGTTDKSTLRVLMDVNEGVPELFRVFPPSYTVGLVIWQGHEGDSEFTICWSGMVLNCARNEGMTAELACEPLSISLKRVGLRRNYQYMCPHVLYGDQCRANKAAATTGGIALLMSGRFLTVVGGIGNYELYAGGMIEWNTPDGLREYRTILAVDVINGNTRFQLSGVLQNMEPGQSVSIVKGCAHTLDACRAVHGNAPNFGGQPFIPTQNPMGRSTPFL